MTSVKIMSRWDSAKVLFEHDAVRSEHFLEVPPRSVADWVRAQAADESARMHG